MPKIVYPKLTPFLDLGFVRIGGAGLCNCMIIAARSYVIAIKNNYNFINPTWGKISFGTYIRREKDKRHYFGLFNNFGISGLKKIYYLLLFIFSNKNIIKIDSLGNYFEDLKNNYDLVNDYFHKIINQSKFKIIDKVDFENVVGIHIRLGDYKGTTLETSIVYYLNLILKIKEIHKDKYKFYIFSDTDGDELKEILSLPGVERKFFGNALVDLVALSRCKMIIGSDSTFSGLAAFLKQVPIIFPKRHFGSVLIDSGKEFVSNSASEEGLLEKYLINTL